MNTRTRFLFNSLGILGLFLVTAMVTLNLLQQPAAAGRSGDEAQAELRTAAGTVVGDVKLDQQSGGVEVRVKVHGLAPGFHGFHIHTIGSCAAPDFTSAGGHFNPAAHSHPGHAGDMPVVLVNADGTGEARFTTTSFQVAKLFDADGSALIIHAGPDNNANIPARYAAAGPDAATLATGDSGGRTACGVIEHDD